MRARFALTYCLVAAAPAAAQQALDLNRLLAPCLVERADPLAVVDHYTALGWTALPEAPDDTTRFRLGLATVAKTVDGDLTAASPQADWQALADAIEDGATQWLAHRSPAPTEDDGFRYRDNLLLHPESGTVLVVLGLVQFDRASTECTIVLPASALTDPTYATTLPAMEPGGIVTDFERSTARFALSFRDSLIVIIDPAAWEARLGPAPDFGPILHAAVSYPLSVYAP